MSRREMAGVAALVGWSGFMWLFGAAVSQKNYSTALETRQTQLTQTAELLAYTQAELKECVLEAERAVLEGRDDE